MKILQAVLQRKSVRTHHLIMKENEGGTSYDILVCIHLESCEKDCWMYIEDHAEQENRTLSDAVFHRLGFERAVMIYEDDCQSLEAYEAAVKAFNLVFRERSDLPLDDVKIPPRHYAVKSPENYDLEMRP